MSKPSDHKLQPQNDGQISKSVGLLRASGIVSAMTMLSRVLGFIRDVVIARMFGAGLATDAFFVAFKIPNFFRRLFAEGAFSQAFVPVFAEYREKHSKEALIDLISHVSGTLGGFLLLLTTIGVSAAPLIILVFAPGFIDDAGRYELASRMLRFTFPYLFFISMVALAGGILNSFQRFAIPALTPVLLNLSLIACAFWLSPQMDIPIMALALGAFIAGVLQLAFQLPFLKQLGMLPRPRWGWKHAGVQKIFKLMIPAMLGSAVIQINLLLDTLIASMLVAGSVSWLYFSDRLVEFPLGVFGIAVATVILPSLSQKHAAADTRAFSSNLDWALRLTLLIAIPAMLGLIILAGPMLATLFQYGEFTSKDTQMASYSLIAYSAGLPAYILVKVLAPAFFSRQDTRTPVKIAVYSMFVNMALNLIFVLSMIFYGFDAPHTGLALATAMAAWVQTALLIWQLKRQQVYQAQAQWGLFLLKTFLAASVMAGFLVYFAPPLSTWFDWSPWLRGFRLGSLVAIAALAYFLTLWLCGIRIHHFRGRV